MTAPIRKLLVANRGEIACRVMRAAQRMGIDTVAVFSAADRDAPHVAMADEALLVGPAEAARSYLDIGRIIDAARRSGADAIHPGYGFLSENADFAEACATAGIVFVGPSPEAIRLMGDKAAAKAKMIEAGVPVVPGYLGGDQSGETLAREAEKAGYPLLIKAAAGGGGRGMRVARDAREFPDALASARREAKAAFGSDTVLLEHLVDNGRHVEVQVFGDRHGNVVHLFERDCSAQRRHQKVIEESPSPAVGETLRERLGQWAVAAARSVAYAGAGTVEFIVDPDGNAFFLEMNTRLQVEHPVTEMVTGVDLVEWQLRVASGERLALRQEEIRMRGHAIEARLYAEAPEAGFLPQIGRIAYFRPAATGDGLRIDAGIAEGGEVTPHYDAMLAKFVAHGTDRDEAISRLTRLIAGAPLIGVSNNGGFLCRLLKTPEFSGGRITTGMLDGWIAGNAPVVSGQEPKDADFIMAGAVAALAPGGSWFRSTGIAQCMVPLECGRHRRTVRLEFERGRLARAVAGETTIEFDAVRWDGEILDASSAGHAHRHLIIIENDRYHLIRDGDIHTFCEPDLLAAVAGKADPTRVVSPTSGRVARLSVSPGDRIARGTAVAAIEAMKMETVLVAAIDGTVSAVHANEGEQVSAGDLIAEIEPDNAEE